MMEKDQNTQETAFNMSLATLERINEVFKYNNNCSLSLNIQGWLLGLDTLVLEVSPMMDSKDTDEFEKLYDKIAFNPNPKTEIALEDNFESRKQIQACDTFLRKILWNKGLTMTKKDDIHKKML